MMTDDYHDNEQIRWEEPPAHGNKKYRYDTLITALQDNPGEWAYVREFEKSSQAGALGQRFKNKGFEFVTRRQDNGMTGTWARWPYNGQIPDN
jgi:hypothetical protein